MKRILPVFLSSLLFLRTITAQIETSRTELSDVNPLVDEFEIFFACKRLFSREGQGQTPVGCGSDADNDGDFGRLIEIVDDDDFRKFQALEATERAVLIPPSVLEDANLIGSIAENSLIKVILVADEPGTVYDGRVAIDLLFTQPVAFLGSRETDFIRARLKENEEREFDDLLWNNGVLMSFYNGKQSVTSEFCLELGECDPLGGQSVWGTVGRAPSSARSILLAVKLDTNGLFHDLTFGARDTAGPLSVLLAVGQAFSSSLEAIKDLEVQIILAAFQGESFDAIGSKRFVFDVENSCSGENFDEENNVCNDESLLTFTEFNNLDLAGLDAIVVLDNILTFNNVESIFIHSANSETLTTVLSEQIAGSEVIATDINSLPTDIIKSFVDLAGFSGEAIMISAFRDDVSDANPGIFSPSDIVDSEDVIDGEFIQTLAVGIASALVIEANSLGDDITGILAELPLALESDFAAEIASCLTIDFTCELVQDVLGFSESFINNVFLQQFGTNRASGKTAPIYFTGVFDIFEIRENKLVSGPEEFTRQFLASRISPKPLAIIPDTETDLSCGASGNCFAKVTGDPGNLVLGDCQPERTTSVACVNQTCICSSVFFHDAVSPLIDETGNIRDEIPVELANEKVITEPRFVLPTVTTFQHTNRFYEISLFVLGVITMGVSYCLITCTLKKLEGTKYKLA